MPSSLNYPKIRPVEAFPVDQDGGDMFAVCDPTGLAKAAISLSRPAMFILSLMDGEHSLGDIERVFREQTGLALSRPQLERMVQQLDNAHFLDSPGLAAYFEVMVEDYHGLAVRTSGDEASFGVGEGGLSEWVERMLAEGEASSPAPSGRLVGLIAPHLDLGRGRPAYAQAYGMFKTAPPPRRVVILGTNHFGRAGAPVATRKAFQTPLGTTNTDGAFIDALERQLDVDLCEDEFDHKNEHSIELQVLILQGILRADVFDIVPVLCHDPCGPTGIAPYEGKGADLYTFGQALGRAVRDDDTPTFIIAGADLSHVGWRFGDAQELNDAFLAEVEIKDRQALDALVRDGRDAFLATLKSHDNSTRVCGAGCIYVLLTALPDVRPQLLGYHQAVDAEGGTAVTCAAVAMWE